MKYPIEKITRPIVKPLEWDKPIMFNVGTTKRPAYGGIRWMAKTDWGRTYQIDRFNNPDGPVFVVMLNREMLCGNPKTLYEAMAICQADHERRVLACLVTDGPEDALG